jgi:toxin YoeB
MDAPYEGIGKPEALKYELSGYWSRRINKEHRYVYIITDDTLIIASLRALLLSRRPAYITAKISAR